MLHLDGMPEETLMFQAGDVFVQLDDNTDCINEMLELVEFLCQCSVGLLGIVELGEPTTLNVDFDLHRSLSFRQLGQDLLQQRGYDLVIRRLVLQLLHVDLPLSEDVFSDHHAYGV